MQVSDLQQLKEYDVWATAKILEQVALLAPEQFTATPIDGYPSVRDTLVHAVTAERAWRVIWQGAERLPALDPADFPTCASIAARWEEEDRLTRNYLATLNDADLERDIVGFGPLGMTIVHVLMHGMQHRSEAAMLLTIYRHSPGNIDLVFYLMQQTAAA
jgi:uncharacterized damage-inducible protein DinB